jgi:hypothetical protein
MYGASASYFWSVRRSIIAAVLVVSALLLLVITSMQKDTPTVSTALKLPNRNTRQNPAEKAVQPARLPAEEVALPPAQKVYASNINEGKDWPTPHQRVIGGRTASFPLVPSQKEFDSAWKEPPIALQGQVTLSTTFGAALNRIAKQADVHLALEVGTWYGGGSTWCLAQGLRSTMTDSSNPDKWMFTLEMFEPAHTYAASTLARLPVTCVRAGTVGSEGYLKPEEIPQEEKTEHYNLYYNRDVELAKTAPAVLKTLCRLYTFDFVLLDGNEYTGYSEFMIVKDICQPKYIALHDAGTLKTRKVQQYLDNEGAKEYELVDHGEDGAKWAVYRKL